jgi:hypothetical protein
VDSRELDMRPFDMYGRDDFLEVMHAADDAGPGDFGMVLTPVSTCVEPGSQVRIAARLSNLSDVSHSYVLVVRGIPESWWTADAHELVVPPGEDHAATVVIAPPGDAAPVRGLSVVIGAVSVRDSVLRAVGEILVTRRESHHRLWIVNGGTQSVGLQLAAGDPAGLLSCSLSPSSLTVEPGRGREVCLRVRLPRSPQREASRRWSFSVTGRTTTSSAGVVTGRRGGRSDTFDALIGEFTPVPSATVDLCDDPSVLTQEGSGVTTAVTGATTTPATRFVPRRPERSREAFRLEAVLTQKPGLFGGPLGVFLLSAVALVAVLFGVLQLIPTVEGTGTGTAESAPGIPRGVQVVVTAQQTLQISWAPVNGAEAYQVTRFGDQIGSVPLEIRSTGQTVLDMARGSLTSPACFEVAALRGDSSDSSESSLSAPSVRVCAAS